MLFAMGGAEMGRLKRSLRALWRWFCLGSIVPSKDRFPMLHCSKICYGWVMSQHITSLNTCGYTTAEFVRINDFVVREDAIGQR
jgi:hypothetical protein